MSSPIQRSIGHLLGEGAGNRLDLSAYQPSSRPRSVQDLDRLRLAAHDAGPGSDAWNTYHHWLQVGVDRDQLPDADGGGIPRSLADTAAEIDAANEQQQRHFQRDRIDPVLLNHGWGGVSFADLGPMQTLQIVAEQMATATPSERAIWARVHQAANSSPYTDMGVSWTAPEPVLEWRANTGDQNDQDPSGLSQYFNNRNDESPGGFDSLYLRNAGNHPSLAGVDMSTTGSGGGTWYADLQIAQENGGFHQGDPSLDVVSPL